MHGVTKQVSFTSVVLTPIAKLMLRRSEVRPASELQSWFNSTILSPYWSVVTILVKSVASPSESASAQKATLTLKGLDESML